MGARRRSRHEDTYTGGDGDHAKAGAGAENSGHLHAPCLPFAQHLHMVINAISNSPEAENVAITERDTKP